MSVLHIVILTALFFSLAVGREIELNNSNEDGRLEHDIFYNPILDERTINPNIYKTDSAYYLIATDNSSQVKIFESKTLENFRDANTTTVYSIPDDVYFIGSAKLFNFDGALYLYFEIYNLLYTMKADDPLNPMGGWSNATLFLNDTSTSSIMEHNNNRYFVSTVNNGTNPEIHISLMTSPVELDGTDVFLREVSDTYFVSPSFLYKDNVTYMLITETKFFECRLTYMRIESDKDPLVPSNWEYSPDSIFTANPAEDVYLPCHVAFTTSPDNTETWMVYAATDGTNYLSETCRLEKVTWDPNIPHPIFPIAHGYSRPQPVPSSAKNLNKD